MIWWMDIRFHNKTTTTKCHKEDQHGHIWEDIILVCRTVHICNCSSETGQYICLVSVSKILIYGCFCIRWWTDVERKWWWSKRYGRSPECCKYIYVIYIRACANLYQNKWCVGAKLIAYSMYRFICAYKHIQYKYAFNNNMIQHPLSIAIRTNVNIAWSSPEKCEA